MKILYPLAKRFIAGHNFDSAKPNIQKLMDEGYEVSIDYVGEKSETIKDCKNAFKQYTQIINFYKNKKIDISIKPTQLGLLINPTVSYGLCFKLAGIAKERGHTIRLDMEDSKVTELTRNLAISLNARFENVGVAIQANLHRTKEDLNILIKKGVSVRLVKGAYKEKESVALQSTQEIEVALFQRAAELIKKSKIRHAIGTHDQELIEDITEMLPKPNRLDFEFLYGIRRDLQKNLKDKKYNVRIYIPFGEDWFPYVVRRLKEFKNLKFIIVNIIKEIFRR
jgi:proline dehydrogenase